MAQQYEQRDNSGTIFKNLNKTKDTQPDWTGKGLIDGKEKAISLWVKQGKNGEFLSASFQEPWKPAGEPDKANGYQKQPLPLNEYPEDEIPF